LNTAESRREPEAPPTPPEESGTEDRPEEAEGPERERPESSPAPKTPSTASEQPDLDPGHLAEGGETGFDAESAAVGAASDESGGRESSEEVVLEFGAGSATPTSKEIQSIPERRAPSSEVESAEAGEIDQSEGPEIRGARPDEIEGVDGSSSDGEVSGGSGEFRSLEELSEGHIEAVDKPAGDSIPELSGVESVDEEDADPLREISEIEPLDDAPKPDDSALGDMASDLDDASVESSDATEAISSEKSRELLENFVEDDSDEAAAQPLDTDGGALGDMAADLDETEGEPGPTRSIDSATSEEILGDYVEEDANDEDGETSGDRQLETLADEMDDSEAESADTSGDTEQISDEESDELLRNYIEDLDSD
jgi:hypothetical protein